MCKLARTITTASTASDVGTGAREDGGAAVEEASAVRRFYYMTPKKMIARSS